MRLTQLFEQRRIGPVYHGTEEKFTSFDPSKTRWEQDQGSFFFTDNRDTAALYGDVMTVYLSFKNPLIMDSDDEFTAIETWDYSDDQIIARAKAGNYDGVIIRGHNESLYVAFDARQIQIIDPVS